MLSVMDIQTARAQAGLTQAELASLLTEQTGIPVSRTAIANWETGVNFPAPRNARAMITVLPGLTWDAIYEPTEGHNAKQGRAAA